MMLAVGPEYGVGEALGVSEGDGLAVSVGEGLSVEDGVAVSVGEGASVGEALGVSIGEGLGLSVGDGAGVSVGEGAGLSVAVAFGAVSSAKATGPRIETIIPKTTKTMSVLCVVRIRHARCGRGPNTRVTLAMRSCRSRRRFRYRLIPSPSLTFSRAQPARRGGPPRPPIRDPNHVDNHL